MRKLTLIIALLVLSCVSAFAQNVLTNPGFEQTPTPIPDDPIPGWTLNNEGWVDMTDFHYAVQSEHVYSGSYALKMYFGPATYGAGWGLYQVATVTQGEIYEASAMWKVTGAGAGVANQVSLLVFPGGWWDNKSPSALYAIHSELISFNHPPFQPMNFDWESTKSAPFTPYEPTGVTGTAHLRSRIKATQKQMTVWIKMTSACSKDIALYVDDAKLQVVNAANSVLGTVYDSVTGQPVPNATVTCSTGGTATTDASGKYKIYFPDAGACSLSVSAAHYNNSGAVPTTLTAKSDNTLNITLVPRPTGTVSGIVTNGSTSVAGANVWTTTGNYSTTADGTGHYSMAVEAGSYTVQANALGYETSSYPASVVAGQNTPLPIVLTQRYVNPQNALSNGNFENGMNSWTEWSASHFADHPRKDPTCPGYGDQWIVDGGVCHTWPEVNATSGVNGSAALRLKLMDVWGTCGGVRQECYVTPGKYYRVRCQWKGRITGEADHFRVALGLINGRFDPGVYDPNLAPPTHVDDVVLMESDPRNYYDLDTNSIPEAKRWWHNTMSSRNKSYSAEGWWEYRDSLENLEPKNNLVGAIKQATGERMTVVLYFSSIDWEYNLQYVDFDNVVLEEVPGPAPVTLGMLSKVDTRPAYGGFPAPVIDVDMSATPKVVTGTFNDSPFCCYIEEEDRSAGIRVDIPDMFTPFAGDTITFKGKLGVNALGERRILMDEATGFVAGSADVPKPLGMALKNLSAKFKFENPLNELAGPGNTGMLVTVWGTVVSSTNDGLYDWIRIDDGSGREIWVSGPIGQPSPSDYVSATGVLSITQMMGGDGTQYNVPLIRVREETSSGDFQIIPKTN